MLQQQLEEYFNNPKQVHERRFMDLLHEQGRGGEVGLERPPGPNLLEIRVA